MKLNLLLRPSSLLRMRCSNSLPFFATLQPDTNSSRRNTQPSPKHRPQDAG